MASEKTDTRDPAELRSAPDPAVLEASGLNSVQVSERVKLKLANIQPHTTSRSIAVILRTHLMTLFNLIIGVCALIIIILGRWLDLLFAIAAVANVVIGFVQEYSAKRKLDAIALLHQDHIRVLRDGMIVRIHREQVVLDDVVELRRGDQVPADGIVLSGHDLDIDESMLTGEAVPVPKHRGDPVLSGTAVLAGGGRFVVTAVGENAHAVKLAIEAKKYLKINSEIRRALEQIAFWLSLVLLPVVAVVFNGQMQAHGGWAEAWNSGEWREGLVTAVSSVTAMIPQGLALMTTITFAVAAVKLAQYSVLIQEQPAVEILARVDVVCLDKTGTLTDGTVAYHGASPLDAAGLPTSWSRDIGAAGHVSTDNSSADDLATETSDADEKQHPSTAVLPKASASHAASPAHTPGGSVHDAGNSAHDHDRSAHHPDSSDAHDSSTAPVGTTPPGTALPGTALPGTALPGTAPWQQVLAYFGADEQANPTAAALTVPFTAMPRHRPAFQVQFSSTRRWSGVAFAPDAGDLAGHWVLGAPEVLLEGPVPAGVDKNQLLRHTDGIAAQGLRTLLLSHAPIQDPLDSDATLPLRRGEELPQQLRPVALVTFKENVRRDAAATLDFFREQHVQLRIISGDNPKTVSAVAREVGMELSGDGVDASQLPEHEHGLRSAVATHQVFGRVTPEQKASMVDALKANGHVVAMTGDGINDALAVKRADLGIAMGSGAPATKAVSRMVLLDGKFSRLPNVLAEGRKVIANTERLAHLFLTKTAYAVVLGIFFAVAFWSFPFLPRQFSTADFLMIGFPAFFLALMPNPQRYRQGFLKRSAVFSLPPMLAICVSLIVVSAFGRQFESEASEIQTASFICLSLVGLWVLNVVLRPMTVPRTIMVTGLYVLLAVVLLLPISQQYHLFALPGAELLAATFVASLVGCGLVELGHRGYVALVEKRHDDAAATPRV